MERAAFGRPHFGFSIHEQLEETLCLKCQGHSRDHSCTTFVASSEYAISESRKASLYFLGHTFWQGAIHLFSFMLLVLLIGGHAQQTR